MVCSFDSDCAGSIFVVVVQLDITIATSTAIEYKDLNLFMTSSPVIRSGSPSSLKQNPSDWNGNGDRNGKRQHKLKRKEILDPNRFH